MSGEGIWRSGRLGSASQLLAGHLRANPREPVLDNRRCHCQFNLRSLRQGKVGAPGEATRPRLDPHGEIAQPDWP